MITSNMSSPTPLETRIRVVLITEQASLQETFRGMLEPEADIDLLVYKTVEEILAATAHSDAHVIVLGSDGSGSGALNQAKRLRQSDSTLNIPLILLSASEGASARTEAFRAGINDYLAYVPDRVELLSRLRYHSQFHLLRCQRDEALEALKAQQHALNKELGDAAAYVSSLFPAPIFNQKGISADWRYMPSSSLGGDTFSYLWLDENRFILELLDVCGHGVGAALLSVSVINTLRSRNATRDREPRPPCEVLSSLNASFPMENNNQMYFTMWFGIFDIRNRELTYSSGGHPPAIAVAPDGSVSQLSTPCLMVGAMPEARYTQKKVILAPGTRLFLFSDGCYEVKKQADGELMSLEDFIQILNKPGQTLDQVVEEIRRIQGSNEFVDDFSLVEFTFA